MPTRLIQISNAKLVQPSAPVPYIALSYCWGTEPPPRTTSSNLDQFLRSIDIETLPPLFRDVISIARRFEINYLWIDSLCIVQNDENDWQTQFPLMASTYEGAQLVIAAASAADCYRSLFPAQRPEPINLEFSFDRTSAPIRVRRVPAVGLHEDYESYFSERDPLDKRSWPLQERLLATRLLVFSATELQWSCKTESKCEAGHSSSAYRLSRSLYSLQPHAAFGFWHEQVMEYSKRRLGYPKDKLPALAGIASKIQKLTGSEYVAGLWRQNLLKDMLWERHIFESLKWEATEVWRAPSFSWASVEGNIFYGEAGSAHNATYVSDVLDVECTAKLESSPFGEVLDGFVRLSTPLIEATISSTNCNCCDGLYHVEHGNWIIRLRSDTCLRQGLMPENSTGQSENTAYRTQEGNRNLIDRAKVWVAIAAYWYEHASHGSVTMWVTCLILGRSQRDAEGFERLGHNNQPWPPAECSLSEEEFKRIESFIYGRAEKTEIKIY
ncbi:MAG: hypothetical protein M1820_005019 [Bogoriella megaspora]|nr:MAG: hypothetical protein M1820_005019 [Bogoriella megaspora]